jgi:hypothetical protein
MVSVTVSPGITFLKLLNRSVSVYSLPGWKSKPFEKPSNVMEGDAAKAVSDMLITTSSISTRDVIALNDFFMISTPLVTSRNDQIAVYVD